jgi:hypothetical protein
MKIKAVVVCVLLCACRRLGGTCYLYYQSRHYERNNSFLLNFSTARCPNLKIIIFILLVGYLANKRYISPN